VAGFDRRRRPGHNDGSARRLVIDTTAITSGDNQWASVDSRARTCRDASPMTRRDALGIAHAPEMPLGAVPQRRDLVVRACGSAPPVQGEIADYALLTTRRHTLGVADRYSREVASRHGGDDCLLGPITKTTSDEQGELRADFVTTVAGTISSALWQASRRATRRRGRVPIIGRRDGVSQSRQTGYRRCL
jgi:hypothetical protein